MADTKISALTALTGASVDRAADVLPIVDTSVTTTKKISVVELGNALFTLAAEQASTSGTSIDFTGIPAGTKRITIMFKGVSTNGTSNPLIQIGDSGGIENTGYLGSGYGSATGVVPVISNYTSGFGFVSGDSANVLHGTIVLTLENSAAFSWICNGQFSASNAALTFLTSGSKSTSAELDRVRITTVNGTDAFDAGAISITYE